MFVVGSNPTLVVIKWVAHNGRRTCPKPYLKGRKRAGAPERRRSTRWSGVIGNASGLYPLECGIIPHLQLQMEKYPMLAKGIDC